MSSCVPSERSCPVPRRVDFGPLIAKLHIPDCVVDTYFWSTIHVPLMDWLAHPVAMAALLTVGGVSAAILVALGLVALTRRGTRAYALVALALVTLLARAVLGAVALFDAVPVATHHLLEHVLDALMAGLVLAAVYHARYPRDRGSRESTWSDDEGGRSELRSDGGDRR